MTLVQLREFVLGISLEGRMMGTARVNLVGGQIGCKRTGTLWGGQVVKIMEQGWGYTEVGRLARWDHDGQGMPLDSGG